MGIYSSNVLRESYYVTDYASQIEPDDNYNAVTGCAMAYLESQQNDLALFNATIANDFQEVAALQEGYEVINEAGSISGIFEKIKQLLLKLIAKIKGIFKAFLAKLSATFGSNKDVYDKYVKQINKYYNWKDFKVKNFRKLKGGGTDAAGKIKSVGDYKIDRSEYTMGLSHRTYKPDSDASSHYASTTGAKAENNKEYKLSPKCTVAGLDMLDDDLDNDKIMQALIKTRIGNEELRKDLDDDLGNMNEAIMDAIFEDADLEDEWKTSDIINGIVGSVLKEGDKIEKEIKDISDNLTKAINKIADTVDKESLKINKVLGGKAGDSYTSTRISTSVGDKKKTSISTGDAKNNIEYEYDTNNSKLKGTASTKKYIKGTDDADLESLSKAAGNIQKVVGQEQELVTKLTSGTLTATKFLVSQARKVWASAAAYSSTEHKNEGYEFYNAIGEASAYDFMSDMEALD